MKIQTLTPGESVITMNGITGIFMGFGERHGLSDIKTENGLTTYKGFYRDRPFGIEYANECGGSWEMLYGDIDIETIIEYLEHTDAIKDYYRLTKQEVY